LQNVFRVSPIGHTPADEVAQPNLLARDSFGNPLILFASHLVYAQRYSHLLLQTNEPRKYCRE
jgi:hypothetical protein